MIKTIQNIIVFPANIALAGTKLKKENIGSQPPKNSITIIALIATIPQYSPRKNNAKVIDEYSTL